MVERTPAGKHSGGPFGRSYDDEERSTSSTAHTQPVLAESAAGGCLDAPPQQIVQIRGAGWIYRSRARRRPREEGTSRCVVSS